MTPDEKAEINAKLDKIIEAIYGNGKPGMVTRLALLEQWQHNMEAQFQRLTAIAVGLGTTLFLGLVDEAHFLPWLASQMVGSKYLCLAAEWLDTGK